MNKLVSLTLRVHKRGRSIMSNKFYKLFVIITLFADTLCVKEIFEMTTILDDPYLRFIFHQFRNFTFNYNGKTSMKRKGRFLQDKFPKNSPFPCDIASGKSLQNPSSVHRLKPGDISVIGALGDSLSCASGAFSENVFELTIENRGVSWCIGGQWDWRNSTTLPNILKMFNPNLIGYSTDDSFPFHRASQLNVAEIGAVSADLPYMAKTLVQRIKSDKRINFDRDWKMITIAIGGNDLCSFICLMENPEKLPEIHRNALIKTLRYLRDELPRTFVNLVSIPLVDTVVLQKKPTLCKLIHRGECSCWVGPNVKKESRERWRTIQRKIIAIEENVAQLQEFQNLDNFAVVYQPFSHNISLYVNGIKDFSLLSVDCFHLSQKGNAWAGVSLWNNLLESPKHKSLTWDNPLKKFKCPSNEKPYIFTYSN